MEGPTIHRWARELEVFQLVLLESGRATLICQTVVVLYVEVIDQSRVCSIKVQCWLRLLCRERKRVSLPKGVERPNIMMLWSSLLCST